MKLVITSLLLLTSSLSISCFTLDYGENVIYICLNKYGIEEADWLAFIVKGGESTEDMYCVGHCVLMINGIIDEDEHLLGEAQANLKPENYAIIKSCSHEPGETTCQKMSNLVTCALKHDVKFTS